MELVNVETGEVVAAMTEAEARAITARIVSTLDDCWGLLIQAYQRRAWVALGYDAWDEYTRTEFGTDRIKLPASKRLEVVASMREAGMSTRAIASATGTNRETIRQTVSGDNFLSPGDGVVDAEIVEESKPIVGTDGKTYNQKPAPSRPKRHPLSDLAQTAGWDFRKATERLLALSEDDRFNANRPVIENHWRSHLEYAIDICNDLLSRLTKEG